MIFELPDIFFGSHKKRKGITTTAGETVRIYKKGRKSLTTSGFFKKSGDIFFGATSQQSPDFLRNQDFFRTFLLNNLLAVFSDPNADPNGSG